MARLVQQRIKLEADDAARGWLAHKGFSDLWHTYHSVCCVHRGAVLTGAETACWHDTVSFSYCAFPFLMPVEDTVEIYVGAGGAQLHIHDNHVANGVAQLACCSRMPRKRSL